MENYKIILYLVFFVFVFFYLLTGKPENFTEADTNEIRNIISQVYDADIESIRNLSKLANDLTNSNKLIVPGGLEIEGSFNLLPRGCIIAYNGEVAPAGWALCNGENGTPDLRGKFIRMASINLPKNGMDNTMYEYTVTEGVNKALFSHKRNDDKAYIDEHRFGQMGGSDCRIQTTAELPNHNHAMMSAGDHWHTLQGNDSYNLYTFVTNSLGNGSQNGPGKDALRKNLKDSGFKTSTAEAHTHTINYTGNSEKFGLSAPYYVLVYIMKL